MSRRAATAMILLASLTATHEAKAQEKEYEWGLPYDDFHSGRNDAIASGNHAIVNQYNAFIHGMQRAYAVANAYASVKFKGPNGKTGVYQIYCPPEKLALNNEQAIDILDRYIDANPSERRTPVSLVLLRALQDTFPCD